MSNIRLCHSWISAQSSDTVWKASLIEPVLKGFPGFPIHKADRDAGNSAVEGAAAPPTGEAL